MKRQLKDIVITGAIAATGLATLASQGCLTSRAEDDFYGVGRAVDSSYRHNPEFIKYMAIDPGNLTPDQQFCLDLFNDYSKKPGAKEEIEKLVNQYSWIRSRPFLTNRDRVYIMDQMINAETLDDVFDPIVYL